MATKISGLRTMRDLLVRVLVKVCGCKCYILCHWLVRLTGRAIFTHRNLKILIHYASHAHVVVKICGHPLVIFCPREIVEVPWKVIVFFLIHLLVQDVIIGHSKAPTSSLFVYFGGTPSRFNSRFKAAIASS